MLPFKWCFSSLFTSRDLIVLALIFRSLIHFVSVFVYAVKKGSEFILSHLDKQFYKHYIVK